MLDRIIFAGSGGHGIQFAGQVLLQAAVLQGLEASYLPSYGAERRGGFSFCTVVVGDHPINSPVFRDIDVLLAFDQRARELYGYQVQPQGIILANSDLAPNPAAKEQARVINVPALQTASQIRKDAGSLNLVMLGAYLAQDRGVKVDAVLEVLQLKSAKKPQFLASNQQALQAGLDLIRKGAR